MARFPIVEICKKAIRKTNDVTPHVRQAELNREMCRCTDLPLSADLQTYNKHSKQLLTATVEEEIVGYAGYLKLCR